MAKKKNDFEIAVDLTRKENYCDTHRLCLEFKVVGSPTLMLIDTVRFSCEYIFLARFKQTYQLPHHRQWTK
jgi:hypothetical protein